MRCAVRVQALVELYVEEEDSRPKVETSIQYGQSNVVRSSFRLVTKTVSSTLSVAPSSMKAKSA